MAHVDREGTPEHTTHFASCGCAEAEIEQQRELLNTAVVKLDSCYQDYKKYRSLSEKQEARIAELVAALRPVVPWAKAFMAIFDDKADDWTYAGLTVGPDGTGAALTMGDLRRIAALKGETHEQG